jgi:PhnB protein
MPKSVSPIPAGTSQASPYLVVRNGVEAIEFYKRAFGAKEVIRIDDPPNKIGHAELKVGTASLMLCDEYPAMNAQSPDFYGGSPVMIHLYVEDVDAVAERAVQAGAKVERPVEDQFYGDRAGKLVDPFGHTWWIATHKIDLTVDEMKKRAAEMQQERMQPAG